MPWYGSNLDSQGDLGPGKLCQESLHMSRDMLSEPHMARMFKQKCKQYEFYRVKKLYWHVYQIGEYSKRENDSSHRSARVYQLYDPDSGSYVKNNKQVINNPKGKFFAWNGLKKLKYTLSPRYAPDQKFIQPGASGADATFTGSVFRRKTNPWFETDKLATLPLNVDLIPDGLVPRSCNGISVGISNDNIDDAATDIIKLEQQRWIVVQFKGYKRDYEV